MKPLWDKGLMDNISERRREEGIVEIDCMLFAPAVWNVLYYTDSLNVAYPPLEIWTYLRLITTEQSIDWFWESTMYSPLLSPMAKVLLKHKHTGVWFPDQGSTLHRGLRPCLLLWPTKVHLFIYILWNMETRMDKININPEIHSHIYIWRVQ